MSQQEKMTPFGEALVVLLDERGLDLAGLVQRMREDLSAWWEPPEEDGEIGVEHFREYMTEPDTFAWSRDLYAFELVTMEEVLGLSQEEEQRNRLSSALFATYEQSVGEWRRKQGFES